LIVRLELPTGPRPSIRSHEESDSETQEAWLECKLTIEGRHPPNGFSGGGR
jgi:hypothetical protein